MASSARRGYAYGMQPFRVREFVLPVLVSIVGLLLAFGAPRVIP